MPSAILIHRKKADVCCGQTAGSSSRLATIDVSRKLLLFLLLCSINAPCVGWLNDGIAVAKLGRGFAPFWEGRAGSPSNTKSPGARPIHTKSHLDQCSHLATIHQRYRQTGQTDRQRSDSIGRTVLQRSPKNHFVVVSNRHLRTKLIK